MLLFQDDPSLPDLLLQLLPGLPMLALQLLPGLLMLALQLLPGLLMLALQLLPGLLMLIPVLLERSIQPAQVASDLVERILELLVHSGLPPDGVWHPTTQLPWPGKGLGAPGQHA